MNERGTVLGLAYSPRLWPSGSVAWLPPWPKAKGSLPGQPSRGRSQPAPAGVTRRGHCDHGRRGGTGTSGERTSRRTVVDGELRQSLQHRSEQRGEALRRLNGRGRSATLTEARRSTVVAAPNVVTGRASEATGGASRARDGRWIEGGGGTTMTDIL
jgi:hypothetical protein